MENIETKAVMDPVKLVKDLADKIGIHQLYAIARDMYGETEAEVVVNELKKESEECKAHINYLREQNENLRGEIKGLRFALRCNGVSGSEVKEY